MLGQLFHRFRQGDTPLAQEHHIGEQVLDLLDLMGGQQDGAVLVEIVVQQVS